MWTSQVYGHHDKMARTKTHRTSQTRSIQRRNIHKEITIFCVFRPFYPCKTRWYQLSTLAKQDGTSCPL